MLTLVIILPCLLIGARFGLIGVATGHLVAVLIRRIISLGLATRLVNVSLADISGVAVKINDQLQEDMNVSSTGKSVNAIRTFAGRCLEILRDRRRDPGRTRRGGTVDRIALRARL